MTTRRPPVDSFVAAGASERLILAALQGRTEVSRAELARLTGLPKTTVTGVVARLLRDRILVESRTEQARGRKRRGRPAAGLALAAPAGLVAVLSFTHSRVRAAVVDFGGTVHGHQDAPLDRHGGERQAVDHALGLLSRVLAGAGLVRTEVTCAVVGIPAPFQHGVGVIAGRVSDAVRDAVPHLPDVWGPLRSDPAPVVGSRLGVPATADNDANLGALGEAAFGSARGLDSFIYIKVVEGLGAGLMLGGRLYRGARGLAGELAHVQVRDDGPWCVCGGRGCLVKTLGRSLSSSLPAAYGASLGFVDVLAMAIRGDAGTRRILGDAGRQVGRVLADACMMLSPEAVVLDGMLGAAAEPFLAGVREMIDRHTPSTIAETVELRRGDLGDRAEILGAVALARGGCVV